MPTIPRYDAQVSPGVSQARQNIQASPDAFGASAARGLQGLSQGFDVVAQRAEQIQLERDDTAAREAYVAASDALRNRMRGESGFLTLRGRDAEETYGDFVQEIDQFATEYGTSLSPRAREAFESMWASRRESALNQGATHVHNERQAVRQAVFEAELVDRRNTAIENYSQLALTEMPDGSTSTPFDAELESGADAIRTRMTEQGIRDTDAVNAAVDQWRSETLRMSITAALDNGDQEAAERLFETRGELLVGADRENARALIRQEGMRTEMQAASADVFAQFGTDRAAARRYIRANYSGEEEDNMISRYNALVGEREADIRRAREATEREVLTMLGEGATWDDLSPSQRAVLDESTQIRLMQGRPIATNPQRLISVTNMRDNPEELAKLDMVEVWSWADEQDYNAIAGWVNTARGIVNDRNSVDPDEQTNIQSFNAAVNRIADANGVTDEREIASLMTELQTAITRIETSGQREGGRTGPLSPEEVNEVIDNYTRQVVLERTRRHVLPGPFNIIGPGDDTPRAFSANEASWQSMPWLENSQHASPVVAAAANIMRTYNLTEVDPDELGSVYSELLATADSEGARLTPLYIERQMVRIYRRRVESASRRAQPALNANSEDDN